MDAFSDLAEDAVSGRFRLIGVACAIPTAVATAEFEERMEKAVDGRLLLVDIITAANASPAKGL